MMLKNSFLIVAAAIGFAGYSTPAALAAPAGERKWELTLIGTGTSDKKFDDNVVAANVNLGYYLTDQHEVAVRQNVGLSNESGDNSFTGETKLAYDFHFDFGQDQRVIPFVGANVGYLYGEDVDNTFTAGLEGGLKCYVNDTTFIFGSVAYQWNFEHGDDADSQFDDGNWEYGLGVGFRF
jgi:hypothetical protein